ncbi:MAG: hypothetical protein ABIK15_00005 [Pseudomonadota bacterium]
MKKREKSVNLIVCMQVIIVSLLIGLMACGGGSDDNPAVQDDTTNSLPAEATETIRADQGGTITLDNGASLTIPPDALPEDTAISLVPVQVTALGKEYVVGMRFEPDGLELSKPAICRLPLPKTWDGDETPMVYEFMGNDPSNFYYTGKYASLSGQPEAYIAEIEISHFSGANLARNCHTGTWQYMLESFRARGCTNEEAIGIIRNYTDKDGNKPFEHLDLPDASTNFSLTEINGSEKAIQAFVEAFFQEIYSYNEGEDITNVNKLLEYASDETNGRKVLLSFTSGDWRQGSDGFYEQYKHTASLEMVNGQVKIRNSVSASHDIMNALTFKNGGNVFWYPKEGGLTAELLKKFREAKPFEALEDELCGTPGCLSDASQNNYGIALNASLQQRTAMQAPWTAMKVYVERASLSQSPCDTSQGEALLNAAIQIPGYYSTTFNADNAKAAALLSKITDSVNKVELDNIPSVLGYTGNDPADFIDQVVVSLNPSLPGPGTYTSVGNMFDLLDGTQVGIILFTDEIRHADSMSSRVPFYAVSGSVVVENFGTNVGDRISGTFDVAIQGEQDVCNDEDCEDVPVLITGTIKGNFDGTLTAQ